jgi:predicted DNA binding CopG/RHH family protein
MLKLDEQKDARFDVRVSMEQLMVIEARALLCGVNRSEYVRSMSTNLGKKSCEEP